MKETAKDELNFDFNLRKFFTTLSNLKVFVILFVVGFLIYGNSLFNGFVGDDEILIKGNPLIRSVANIPRFFSIGVFSDDSGAQGSVFYRPVSLTYVTLAYSFFGQNGFFYHFVQIALHETNSFLVFLIFKYFLKKNFSFFFALVFLLHPINTEAVVYFAAFLDPLFAFFGLAALYFALKRKRIYDDLLVPVLLVLSIFSKETGFIFIPIILALRLIFHLGKSKLFAIQSLLVVGIYVFFRFVVAHIYFSKAIKIAPIMEASLLQRLIHVPKIIYFYVFTFIYPKDLIIFQNWPVRSFDFKNFFLPLLFDLVFFCGLIFMGFYIRRAGSKNILRVYAFFFVIFLIGLAPHMQIIPLDQIVDDRWFYIATFGLLGMLGAFFQVLIYKKRYTRYIFLAIFLGIISVFSLRVIVRNTNWVNEKTLYEHDIKNNKDSYQLENGLGRVSFTNGEVKQAETHYARSANMYPGYLTYTNLAHFYQLSGDIARAKSNYSKALEYGGYYGTYELYSLLLLSGDPKEAVAFITSSLKKYPNAATLWEFLAVAKFKQGLKDEALFAAKKAYEISPIDSNLQILQAIEKNKGFVIKP